MSLSSMLSVGMQDSTGDDQGAWRQYILDHLDYIKIRSVSYDLSDKLVNQYRYDLKRFLLDNLKRRTDIAWIVLMLNSMHSDLEFDEPGEYIIPSDELILRMYHSHKTVTHNIS